MRPRRPVAVVTGASRGIGRAIAKALAPNHALILVARSAERLHPVGEELAAMGIEDVQLVAADLADADAISTLVGTLGARDPAPQVLVNNAGVASSARIADTDDSMWRRVVDVNLSAPFSLCRGVIPRMRLAGWGRIVNIASTAGLKGYRFTAAYSASKAGLVGLTRALAAELAGTGITVNAVCPGFTDTDIVQSAARNISAKTGRSEEQALKTLASFSPLGRLVRPEEVAQLVAYLCSEFAATVNGQAMAIDGGETAT